MLSARETILSAPRAALRMLPAAALRREVLPERIAAAGLLILRDDEPGEPDVMLSPLACAALRLSPPRAMAELG